MSRTLIIAAVAAFDLVGPTSIAWVQKADGTLVQITQPEPPNLAP